MIRKYLYPLRFSVARATAIKIVGTLSELLLPYILALMIDKVVPAGKRDAIYFWGFMMLLASVTALLGHILANRLSSRVASDAIYSIRSDLFRKTLGLGARQISTFGEASLESRLTSDTYHVHNMISRLQRLGIRAPLLLFGGLIMTYLLDWRLALILTALLPFIAVFTFWIAKRGRPKYLKQQTATDHMVQKVRETVSGIRVIKSLVTGEREKEQFAGVNRRLVELETDAAYNMALTNPIMTLLMNAGLALVLVFGAYLIHIGLSLHGSIVAFLSYFTIITNSMVAISRIFTIYNRGMASAKRIDEILQTEDELSFPAETVKDEAVADAYASETPNPHIEFDDVSFSYNQGQDALLRHINFKLMHGQTLGILGETGSGKSTLLALLLRLYDADSGQILIDGQDIKTLSQTDLYDRFGLSLQNDFLYGDTIRANIDFGRGLPEDTLIQAAKDAEAWPFISERAEGLDFKLASRASNLSGGQKQRLLITRALASDPELLIFDDSSSALDYRTDAKLRRTLGLRYRHTTKLIVAQRISSVHQADLILVMQDGEIRASGTHDELMETSEIYREMAAVQMGLISEYEANGKILDEALAEVAEHSRPRERYTDAEEDGDLYG